PSEIRIVFSEFLFGTESENPVTRLFAMNFRRAKGDLPVRHFRVRRVRRALGFQKLRQRASPSIRKSEALNLAPRSRLVVSGSLPANNYPRREAGRPDLPEWSRPL